MAESLHKQTAVGSSPRQREHFVPKALRGWVLPLGLLLLWWASTTFGWIDSPLLPTLQAVWRKAVGYTASGELRVALGASLWRTLAGFAIGSSVGLLLGGLLGFSRFFERTLGPSFHAFKQISLFAWVPLISVWFGLGDTAKVAFIALAAFFPLVLNTFEGVRSVPFEFLEVARVLKFSRWQLLRKVVFPAASASILTGLHLALIYSWLASLGAEYLLVAGKGIGNTLVDGREHFHMDLVIFGVVVIGLVGFALNTVAALVEKRLLAWRGQSVGKF